MGTDLWHLDTREAGFEYLKNSGWSNFKGIVHSKMKLIFIHPYVIPNPHDFISSVEYKRSLLVAFFFMQLQSVQALTTTQKQCKVIQATLFFESRMKIWNSE